MTATHIRRRNAPSLIRKILRIFKKDSSAESPSIQAKESIHVNIPTDWKSIEAAMLKAEHMKAEGYLMFERQRLRWLLR